MNQTTRLYEKPVCEVVILKSRSIICLSDFTYNGFEEEVNW